MEFKSGYVGVIGKSNVGKSSLINYLVGHKVSIVTPKTQTTQTNILGILTKENYQIIFVDTPGIHKSANNLDKAMMKQVRSAIGEVDIILYVVDGTRKFDNKDFENIAKYSIEMKIPTILAVSKIDLINKNTLLELLSKYSSMNFVKDIIPFSSKTGENTEIILHSILDVLPTYEEKTLIFDDYLYTNNTVRFMASEIIREKAMLLLEEELPHGVKINITKFDEIKPIIEIDAELICEKENHKPIIIGKNGNKIKEIGTKARKDIEDLLDQKIMLNLFVKVDKNWRQKENNMV